MTKPSLPCRQPGCYNLQPCPLHPIVPFQSARRSPSKDYGVRHKQWRALVLVRDPICKEPGCTAPSTQADHIIPIRKGGARFDLANGRGMCRKHHSAKTGREIRHGN